MSVVITTNRTIIRTPEIDDFDAIWKMKNDPLVAEYTGGTSKLTRAEAFELHKKKCMEFEMSKDKVFTVALKDSNEYIGYCGLKYCEILNGIEILYGFSKSYWGKGFAKETAKAVLDYGLRNISAEIVAAVHPNNVGSEKVLQAIGMRFEGKVEWPQQGLVNKYRIQL